jgi:hypothetical protein
MTTSDHADWLANLQTKLATRRLLFVQLGAAHEPARRALGLAGFTTVDVEQVTSETVDSAAVVVIDRLERLIAQRGDLSMGPLREEVFSWIEHGKTCILLSRSPRAAYPAVPGSSLLDDASFAHGPDLPHGPVESWPTCSVDGDEVETVLRKALHELGPEVCGALDRAIFECLLTGMAAIDLLGAREVEAIQAAGLISSVEQGLRWNFPTHLNALKEALGDVLSDDVLPQAQLDVVSQGLWQIERMLRRTIRLRSIAAWGPNWRQQCVSTLQPSEVLKRATEAAYPGANSIKLLRDPLEWLTLGELLELKNRAQIGDLGMTPGLWRNFAADIMPIRNRLAHMRTLHPGDAADVAKWLRALEVKLAIADTQTRKVLRKDLDHANDGIIERETTVERAQVDSALVDEGVVTAESRAVAAEDVAAGLREALTKGNLAPAKNR